MYVRVRAIYSQCAFLSRMDYVYDSNYLLIIIVTYIAVECLHKGDWVQILFWPRMAAARQNTQKLNNLLDS